jgi:serine/threonine-protein kinase
VLAGKYRVENVVGSGGMGAVVAATHLLLKQRVALKFLLAQTSSNPDLVARFVREAQAAACITSEHVARTLDVGTLDLPNAPGTPYLVMELLSGRDLDAIVRSDGPLPIPTAIDYLLQACEAIAEAHLAGIVHRDLKPANLFVTRRVDGSPCVKVLDFGISKMTAAPPSGEAVQALTATGGAMIGSPLYMSPEQIRSAKEVDARTDIWSLGVILHELLTGQTPFLADNLGALLAVIVADPPVPLRAVLAQAPAGLEEVILRCLEKDRERRWQTLDDFAAALGTFASPAGKASVDRIARMVTGKGKTEPPPPPQPVVGPVPGGQTAGGWGNTQAAGDTAQRRSVSSIAVAAGIMAAVVAAIAGMGLRSHPTSAAGGGAPAPASAAVVPSAETPPSMAPTTASATPSASPPSPVVAAPPAPSVVVPRAPSSPPAAGSSSSMARPQQRPAPGDKPARSYDDRTW